MQVLNRLKMELSNQEYFTDEQYIQFLTEKKYIYSVISNLHFCLQNSIE